MTTANREQQKEKTRQKILQSAITTFADVGFDAASIGDIAKNCGTKKALVQYHFETKDKLWKAAVDELWGQLRQSLPTYIDQTSIDNNADYEALRTVFKQVIRLARDHPAWVGIMFREASSPGPRLDWLIEHYLRKDYDDGMRFITMAQQQKLLPDTSPLHLLHIVSGALTYALIISPLTKKVTGVDMRSEQSLDTLVDTLMLLLQQNS